MLVEHVLDLAREVWDLWTICSTYIAFWAIQCTHLVSRNICANLQVLLTAAVKQSAKRFGPLLYDVAEYKLPTPTIL